MLFWPGHRHSPGIDNDVTGILSSHLIITFIWIYCFFSNRPEQDSSWTSLASSASHWPSTAGARPCLTWRPSPPGPTSPGCEPGSTRGDDPRTPSPRCPQRATHSGQSSSVRTTCWTACVRVLLGHRPHMACLIWHLSNAWEERKWWWIWLGREEE